MTSSDTSTATELAHHATDAITSTEILIIGAGVIGSAIALELARRGARVTVVDSRGGPGYGSTSASSAMVRYHYHHFPEAEIGRASCRERV